ncbi:RNA binding protein [Oryctes borbonicus]|uniref:RNA binding protein n=1 Tax=Oryctes borbonicus TaxID=1629725 RepID=A0A0T6AY47_9SCAR|nr:RNA binding protein [Oryctes borbonicus]
MVKKNNRSNPKFKKSGSSLGIKTRLGTFKAKASVVDARQKLMQKKRNQVVDARDILAGMARKQDARDRIQMLREKGRGESIANGNVRVIGSSILKKTDRNGKISLVTNKVKVSNDLNIAIQQQLGLISPTRATSKKVIPKRSLPSRPKTPPFIPPVIRKTILNDYIPPVDPSYRFDYDQSDLYRWYRTGHPSLLMSQELEARRPKLTRNLVTDSANNEWRSYRSSNSRPSTYVDLDAVDDEDMPLVPPPRPTMGSKGNIHSRLDSTPPQQQSHGILANSTKTKVVVPIGHRIVVSNLQNGVTEDDIRELFEDIGQLLVARLVRPGTAEVIYKNLKDAQKAVDTYHNRQLDGQPMKCLLVNKRPLNNPTAPAITSNIEGSISVSKSTTSSNKLVPDLSTIHKVLFQRN